MTHVHCSRHGPQPETFVCEHIAQTMRDGTPRGFFWSDSGDRGDAWCTQCNALLKAAGGEWTREIEVQLHVKLLCGRCYDEAKQLNGF